MCVARTITNKMRQDARTLKSGERLVKLRNPWGKLKKGIWDGPWSDGSKEWTNAAKEELNHKFGNDSVFWIKYEDMLRKYQHFDRTRLFRDPDWRCCQRWIGVEVPWKAQYNEKFHFTLTKESPLVLVLSQLDNRYFKGLHGQYNFRLHFRLHEQGKPDGEDYIVRSHGNYLMDRSVTIELPCMEPGKYSVFVSVVGERDTDFTTIEDVVKRECKKREDHDKLASVGYAYDLAHSKGVAHLEQVAKLRKQTDQKKASTSRQEERRKIWEKRHLNRDITKRQQKKNQEKRDRRREIVEAERKKKEEAEAAELKKKEEAEAAELKKKEETETVDGKREDEESKDDANQADKSEPTPSEDKTEKAGETSDKSEAAEEDPEPVADDSKTTEDKSANGKPVEVETSEAKLAEEKARAEKAAVEKAAVEKAAVEKAAEKATVESVAAEKAAAEKAAAEKAAAEKAAAEKAAADIKNSRDRDYSSDNDSSDSPIEDWEELYSSDDMSKKPRMAAPPPAPAAAAVTAETDEEAGLPDPWNAICIVGFRVYSKDENLDLRVVIEGGELAEGGMGQKGAQDIDNAQINAAGEREKNTENDKVKDEVELVDGAAVVKQKLQPDDEKKQEEVTEHAVEKKVDETKSDPRDEGHDDDACSIDSDDSIPIQTPGEEQDDPTNSCTPQGAP
jgi:hypothetical protein